MIPFIDTKKPSLELGFALVLGLDLLIIVEADNGTTARLLLQISAQILQQSLRGLELGFPA